MHAEVKTLRFVKLQTEALPRHVLCESIPWWLRRIHERCPCDVGSVQVGWSAWLQWICSLQELWPQASSVREPQTFHHQCGNDNHKVFDNITLLCWQNRCLLDPLFNLPESFQNIIAWQNNGLLDCGVTVSSVSSWAARENPTKGCFKGSGWAWSSHSLAVQHYFDKDIHTEEWVYMSRFTKVRVTKSKIRKVFQWLSRVTLWRGSSQVSFESTLAITGTSCFGACVEEMEKEVIGWENESWEIPAIPEMCAALWVRGRQRCWANRSEMNDTEEPESSSLWATVDKPFEALTVTQHVIKSALV